MDDLISRQAAITAIQKAYCDTECGEDKYAVWKNVGLTEALHIMQDLPPAQRWIPEIEALTGMPAGVGTIALAYARSMVTFGVNITEKWETVTQQQAALDAAYRRGRYDEWKRWAGKEE